jgi:pyruvate dehydrogenase E2 component (dihydrolipoamide acetyltransferase)
MTIAGRICRGEGKKSERPKSVSVVGVLPEEEEGQKAEVLATPAVRALARELGVRLETLKGSGPSGSITPEDVKRGAEKPAAAEDRLGPVERIPLRGLRRTIARNLMTSQKTTVSVPLWMRRTLPSFGTSPGEGEKGAADKRHPSHLPAFFKKLSSTVSRTSAAERFC